PDFARLGAVRRLRGPAYGCGHRTAADVRARAGTGGSAFALSGGGVGAAPDRARAKALTGEDLEAGGGPLAVRAAALHRLRRSGGAGPARPAGGGGGPGGPAVPPRAGGGVAPPS